MSSPAVQPPVIVVHGITGSVLRDFYPTTPEIVWDPGVEVTRWQPVKEFTRIAMHPDDLKYEAVEPAKIVASHAAQLGYSEFITELRSALREHMKPDEIIPVFSFAYDWRHDSRVVGARLCEFVGEVIERANLHKTYKKNKATTVDLVGHSMGGLVIAAALSKGCKDANGKPLVRRVVSIGTPFMGAVDAVMKLTTGEGSVVGSPSHSERLAARMTPALYQLLPYFDGALEGHPGKAILDVKHWQESILETIAEFIKAYSQNPKLTTNEERKGAARKYLTDRLVDAADFFKMVNALDPKKVLADPGSWLVIVGMDERTSYAVKLLPDGKFDFAVEPKEYRDDRGPGLPQITAWRSNLGDGTVPLRGAVPAWAARESVVGVTEKDFGGFLGFGENLPFRKFMTLHSALPLMNLVQRWTISYLKDERWGKLWGRPLPDIAGTGWKPPVKDAQVELYDYQKVRFPQPP